MSIDIRDRALSSSELDDALRACICWLHQVDELFSTYKVESQISRLGRGQLNLPDASPEVRQVLARCEKLKDLTDGYFDAMAGGHLDPSGLVKGWAVQRASWFLVRAGSSRHCINAAGDIAVIGGAEEGRPWRVGISHPLVGGAFCAVVGITDGAVATSGTAERGFHVLDPHTGRPATDLASVTVIGPDLGTADAYATAALAMGRQSPRWLQSLDGHEAYLVDHAGHAWASDGFARHCV